MSKKVSLLLLIFLVVNWLSPLTAIGAWNDPDLYQGISGQIPYSVIKDELPPGMPQYSDNNLKLNTEIWKDKHLVVYGDYSTVNYGSANVKYYHEDDPNDLEFYYFRDSSGRKCEYRYLGYTREGNKFPNPKFPADYRTDIPPEDITWYSFPWKLGKHYMENISYTNSRILDLEPGSEEAVRYIEDSLDWNVIIAKSGKTKQELSYEETISLEKYHFFNVDSPPSAHFPGRGRMINYSYSKDKDYY